jgi:UDP-N-acetylmuramyl pentapeptide synthase
MGEVGARGPEFHAEVGRYAKQQGISALLAFGSASKESVVAFGEGGAHFEDWNEISSNLKNTKTILVKGSRFMRMERVVAALVGEMSGSKAKAR